MPWLLQYGMTHETTTTKGGFTMADESPYGHDYPVLDALADWVQATEPYTTPIGITDEIRLELNRAARVLNSAINDLIPYQSQVRPGDEGWETANNLWSLAYHTRAHIRDLTGQFLLEEYTDSNTDEPCDAEWNVTGLVMLIHPDYERPDDIRPGFVGYLIDEGPKDDEA
jgi:hypothetical protein